MASPALRGACGRSTPSNLRRRARLTPPYVAGMLDGNLASCDTPDGTPPTRNLRRGASTADNLFAMHRLAIGFLALLAACTQTVADEAISVCAPLCRCIDVPLPDVQRECTATCTTQFEQGPLGAACATCIVGHANRCTTLITDCDPVCRQPMPLQSYGVSNEPGIEDR